LGHLEVIRKLISVKADVNAKTESERSPLELDWDNTRLAIEQYLVKQNLVTPTTYRL